MKILIVGGGGREHALAWKFSQDPQVTALFCAPSNAGISEIAERVPISATDIDGLLDFVAANGVDLTVVCEAAPLALGIVDSFESQNLRIFGPSAAAAALESSKIFAKLFMERAGVPTAGYVYFDDFDEAKEHLLSCVYPCVVKADVVTDGKAVLLCRNYIEALNALTTIMLDRSFGNEEGGAVIEEMVDGPEVNVFAFCDGASFVLTPGVKVYRQARDCFTSYNTPGMGAVSPHEMYTPEINEYCERHIFAPFLAQMAQEGHPFKGVLGLSLILEGEGVKVVGVNTRLGDPEAQVLLPRMKSELLPLINACVDGALHTARPEWTESAAACVVLTSRGYPLRYRCNYEISGLLNAAQRDRVSIFHSGTTQRGDEFYTSKGRVLGVCAMGKNARHAAAAAYEAAGDINFEGMHMREDIGAGSKKGIRLPLTQPADAGRKKSAFLTIAQAAGIVAPSKKDSFTGKRLFIEKRAGLDTAARELQAELEAALGAQSGLFEELRLLYRYDIGNISAEAFEALKLNILTDNSLDLVYEDQFPMRARDKAFTIAYLPEQYDQNADYILTCAKMFAKSEEISVDCAKVVVLDGNISRDDLHAIKNYCINPVDSRDVMGKTPLFHTGKAVSRDNAAETLTGFITMDDAHLEALAERRALGMALADMRYARDYFHRVIKRDPTATELMVLDAYWSDNCRHTTFLTHIETVEIERGHFTKPIMKAYSQYVNARHDMKRDGVYDKECLMDVSTIALKSIKKRGLPVDLIETGTPGVYAVKVDVDVDGRDEPWLLMLRNRSNNHPTELEPFGGAGCCVGGAVRAALSDRGFAYQAIRISGGADPRAPVSETSAGKLSARALAVQSARGASEYANQMGLPVGFAHELFHEGFAARRLEAVAVVGAAPEENIPCEPPACGDLVVLLGGRTGRDNCGGIISASKAGDELSITKNAGKIQKGNPVLKRRLQRFIRKKEVAALIKRAHGTSGGGIAITASRLAAGMLINLDLITTKYEGLSGAEIALAQSQECIAAVVAEKNLEKLMACCAEVNLEASVVARVTDDEKLRMVWHGKTIFDLNMDFLKNSGVAHSSSALIAKPDEDAPFFKEGRDGRSPLAQAWLEAVSAPDSCSQQGLSELFAATCGGGAVVMPFGGKERLTPAEASVSKLPVGAGETNTVSILAYGYDPRLSSWSPFHGAVYSVVEALTRITACGGGYENARLCTQKYFEKLGADRTKWGKALSSLLGSYYAQMKFGLPVAGGQNSASGTFKDINVPPVLLTFALCVSNTLHICTPEFKKIGSQVVYIPPQMDEHAMPDFDALKSAFSKVHALMRGGKVLAAHSVKARGLAEAISIMCLGSDIGVEFECDMERGELLSPGYGGLVLELFDNANLKTLLSGVEYKLVAKTTEARFISLNGTRISLADIRTAWAEPLANVFPTRPPENAQAAAEFHSQANVVSHSGPKAHAALLHYGNSFAKPRVCLPVLPGSRDEDDIRRAFVKAGAHVEEFVLQTATYHTASRSIRELAELVDTCQIFVAPGGGEAFGGVISSASLTATVLKDPRVANSIMELLRTRKGLILGIGGGFQALLKLGLLPYGKFTEPDEYSPFLARNISGRHIERMLATRVVCNRSPWLCDVNVDDIHTLPASHWNGRFVANDAAVSRLITNSQIATVYHSENPSGSTCGIEGIVSPCGRVFGKTCRSDRTGADLYKNIAGDTDQKLFNAGVKFFK